MDLSAFTRAGLKLNEIATIVGVSYTTAGLWMRGRRTAHFLLAGRVNRVLEEVTRAVDKGDLPLSAAIPRAERMEKIKNAIAQ